MITTALKMVVKVKEGVEMQLTAAHSLKCISDTHASTTMSWIT